MNQNNYQNRSLILLLPLGLLAIFSFALDRRIPLGIDMDLQIKLFQISRTIIPGLFALTVALLVPTINRPFQILAVAANFVFLSSVSIAYYPDLFSQPTSWIIASLSVTLILLPNNYHEIDLEPLKFKTVLLKLAGVISLPTLVLITLVVIVRNIEHTIVITFNAAFIDSILACLFVPIYEAMLTLGFSSLLNSLSIIQIETDTVQAFLNTIILINLLSLPSIILAQATFSQNKRYTLFLLLLALIVCLTSKVGACISVELVILMLFYPSLLVVLFISSIILYFICYSLVLGSFTSFDMLYQPDLLIKSLSFMRISSNHYLASILAVVIPFVLQFIFTKLSNIKNIKMKHWNKGRTSGYFVNQDSNPDLINIAILKSLGGKSNLQDIFIKDDLVSVKVFDIKKVSVQALNALSGKKIKSIKNQNSINIQLGKNAKTIYQRLFNIIESNTKFLQNEVQLTTSFDIEKYCTDLKERQKHERQRLATN